MSRDSSGRDQRARTWTSVDDVPLTTRLVGDLVREIGLYSAARWVWLCGCSLSSALCGRSRTSLPSSATPSSAGYSVTAQRLPGKNERNAWSSDGRSTGGGT